MECKHNKIIRIIKPAPGHQCESCGQEFVPAAEAEASVSWALWLGFTAGAAVMLIVGLLMLVVVK